MVVLERCPAAAVKKPSRPCASLLRHSWLEAGQVESPASLRSEVWVVSSPGCRSSAEGGESWFLFSSWLAKNWSLALSS